MSASKDQEWNTLHMELKETMQKEVHVMRELLANMHQEEISLMLNDQGSLQELLQQRSIIVERLSNLRTSRMDTTGKIEKIVAKENPPTPERVLPTEEETSTEIFSLSDQLMALTEQMNRQKIQNQYLTDHPEHWHPAPASSAARAKKKASVATYQIKK
ncbi:MAG TPA: hypothetical protein VGJ00_02105 [Rhabdochlamydiaceae bacterium]|jgi:hypothetical protein